MSSDDKVTQLLKDIVARHVPTENVAVAKNVPSDVSDEALTNYLEVVSENYLDVDNIYSYHIVRDLRLVQFTSRFKEDGIKERLNIKLLNKTKIFVTEMESPGGIFLRHIPDKATKDLLTFYFEGVLRKGGAELEVNTQIFEEIGLAVLKVEDPDRGLPLIFETEPHKVCDVVITLEPYVQGIHDHYIAALKQKQGTSISKSSMEPDLSHNIFVKNGEKDSLYMKCINTPGECNSKQDRQGEITSENTSTTKCLTPTNFEVKTMNNKMLPRTEGTKNKTQGNLRIFSDNFDQSDQQVNQLVISDNNTPDTSKSSADQTDSSRKLDVISSARSSSMGLLNLAQKPLTFDVHPTLQDTNKSEFKYKKQNSFPKSKSETALPPDEHLMDYPVGDNLDTQISEETSSGLVPRGQMSDITRSHIEHKIDYSVKKENIMILKISNFTRECPNCDIKFDVNRGTIVIKGTSKDIEIAKLKHYEILYSVKQESLPVSKNKAAVMSTPKAKNLIEQKLRSEKVKAYVTVTSDCLLEAFAFSKGDAKKAIDVVQGSLVKKDIPYNESHFQFLNGSLWKPLVESLQMSRKSMVKIEVLRGQKIIVIEGWKQEVLKTVTVIQDALKDNSDGSVSAKLSGGQAKCFNKFLRDKMQDVYDTASKNKVKVKIVNGGDGSVAIEINGNKDGVKIVESQVQLIVRSIWHRQLDFGRISTDNNDKALMSKALSSNKGANFIRSFEQQHRCVIEINEGKSQVSMASFEFTSNSNEEEILNAYSMADEEEPHFRRWSDDCSSSSDSESRIEDEGEYFTDSENDILQLSEEDFAIKPVVRSSNREVTSQKCGNTVIRIKQGDITREKADALVNVVPIPSMRVEDSAIYSAFVKEGGDELKMYFQKCKASADRNVVYTQTGGKLMCTYVLHMMLEKWQEGVSSQTLKLALESCFQWCDSLGVIKIAFPAVGVGKYLKYPPETVAKLMMSEAKKAAMKNKIEEISFVIYDSSILSIYKKALENDGSVFNPFRNDRQLPDFSFPRQLPDFLSPRQLPDYFSPRQLPNSSTPSQLPTFAPSRELDFSSNQHYARNRPALDLYVPRHERHNRPRRERNPERSRRPQKSLRPKQHRKPTQDEVTNPEKVQVKLVIVDVFAEETSHGEKVMSELSKKIKAEFLAFQEINNPRLKHLSKEVKKKIFDIDACKHRRVTLNLNAGKQSITIKGEASDVNSTKSSILEILLNSDVARVKERQPRQRQHQRGTKEYWRELCEIPPTPCYWKHFKKGFSVFDPLRNFFNSPRVEYEDVDRKTYSAILKLINNTWQAAVVGQGNDAKNLNHKNIRVTKIQRIENFDLYRKYSIKRIEFFQSKHRHHGNVNKFLSLEKIPISKGQIAVNKHIEQNLMLDIFPEINEQYLFHGTTDTYVENILKRGLDFRNSSEKGMLGKGTYAAESSTKADQYADDPRSRQKKDRKMLLTRMLLGNIFVAKNPQKYSKPPCQCMKDGCVNSEHDQFDSVVGEITNKLFREFVVYSLEQCYPEYLITYDRV